MVEGKMDSDQENVKQKLKECYAQRAIQFGQFTLASGKQSNYYIDSKRVLFNSEAISLLGECLYYASVDEPVQALGGLEIGAIPMATAAIMSYHRHGKMMEGFFVRKQAKDHGTQKRVEGRISANDSVIIIDDVLTTGESVIQAITEVEKIGAKVKRVISVVDRLQGARERLIGYDFRPIFTIRDFGIEPLKD